MAQTDLKSDAWCGYNSSASPFFWVMEPGQYNNTYVFGEVGVSAAGGSPGSYVRPETIDVSSFLSGRDDMLSKCQPPVPDLDELKVKQYKKQDTDKTINLLSKYTREKKSATDLSSVDYNRWTPQDIEPQDLRFIIEDMWAQRGGLDTQNYSKLAWVGGSYQYKEGACNTTLDPSRACGEFCESVSGYNKVAKGFNKPTNEPNYPFVGPYSQDVVAVGADTCGPNHFYGDKYTDGKCPVPQSTMLEGVALSTLKFPLKI
jgi:hypothetical protein